MSRRITGYILNESGQDDYIWQRERINRVFDGIPVLFRGEDVYEGEDKHLMYIDALAEDHKKGDLIVMDRISRVSGSPERAAEFYMKCMQKGIELRFLNEGWLDTSTMALIKDQELLHRFLLTALEKHFKSLEDMAADKRNKKSSQMMAARNRGAKFGGPKGVQRETEKARRVKEYILENSREFNGHMIDKDLMESMPESVTRTTFYKYKSQLKAAYGSKKEES